MLEHWKLWEPALKEATERLHAKHPGESKQRIRAALKRCANANHEKVLPAKRRAYLLKHGMDYLGPRRDDPQYMTDYMRTYMSDRRKAEREGASDDARKER